ncbi:MAG TPA: queuosine precursor transporter [Polyangia bacterium]|nr:queuosine precursor transporter [Polyangia bacterium]
MLDLTGRQRLYMYLCGIFLTALLIGDTIGSKLFILPIPLGFTTVHATLSVGVVWFPITFLLTDVINEFYGSKGARFVTYLGFWMALLAFFIIYCARKIPAADFSPVPQAAFDNVLGNANTIFFASLVAYLAGQIVDISVFQLAKRFTQSRHIWLRSTGSTLVSQLIDTVLVTVIAFSSKLSAAQLRHTLISQYFVKVLFAVALTPIIYAFHGVLHRRLHMEEHPAQAAHVHEPMP